MTVVMKEQLGRGFKNIVQGGLEMTDCGCQMGRQGNKDRKGLTNKKKTEASNP